MNDCPNAEIRDRLPELLHDRLDESARAAVSAHVGTCADCREELELLRGMHGMLIARTPRVDVAFVVAALPKPVARRAQPMRPRRSWSDWRIAAAITMVVAGASSVAVYNHLGISGAQSVAAAMPIESAPANNSVPSLAPTPALLPSNGVASAAIPAETVAIVSPDEGLGMAGAVSKLNDRQLQVLLDDIDRMESVPITDPEPVSIKVEPRSAVPSNGRGSEQ